MKIVVMLTGGALLVTANLASAQAGPMMGSGRGQGAMMMSKIDIDGDGFISVSEHRRWVEQVFATMDTNNDGKLSREEYLAVHMGPGPRGPGNQAHMQAIRKQADARKAEQFTSMDTDKDGFATRAEFLAQADRNFVAKDANKDGKLSTSEFQAWRADSPL